MIYEELYFLNQFFAIKVVEPLVAIGRYAQ